MRWLINHHTTLNVESLKFLMDWLSYKTYKTEIIVGRERVDIYNKKKTKQYIIIRISQNLGRVKSRLSALIFKHKHFFTLLKCNTYKYAHFSTLTMTHYEQTFILKLLWIWNPWNETTSKENPMFVPKIHFYAKIVRFLFKNQGSSANICLAHTSSFHVIVYISVWYDIKTYWSNLINGICSYIEFDDFHTSFVWLQF